MNFLAWQLGWPVVSRTNGEKVDVWAAVKLDLLSSLGHVIAPGAGYCNEVGAGREWSDNDDDDDDETFRKSPLRLITALKRK